MSGPLDKLHSTMSTKLNDSFFRTFYLGVLAGIYIGIGAVLFLIITSLNGNQQLLKFLGAVSFTLGLNLIVFKKAQLFTGNNLMLINIFEDISKSKNVIQNWIIVYLGNLAGSLLVVLISNMIFSNFINISEHVFNIATTKINYSFNLGFFKAIYCNILVCIAVYFAIVSKSILKKIIGIVIPITAFVYFGFEHSIANMFFIPLGLSFSSITLTESIILTSKNLSPVTLGNIIGGLIVSIAINLIHNKRKSI